MTPTAPSPDPRKTEWWTWMRRNPEIFHRYETIALDMISRGIRHGSSDDILHTIRKEVQHLKSRDGSGYKINNTYSPYFARYFVHLYPEHASFFEFRASKADTPQAPRTKPSHALQHYYSN
jgi:hypothetical protein